MPATVAHCECLHHQLGCGQQPHGVRGSACVPRQTRPQPAESESGYHPRISVGWLAVSQLPASTYSLRLRRAFFASLARHLPALVSVVSEPRYRSGSDMGCMLSAVLTDDHDDVVAACPAPCCSGRPKTRLRGWWAAKRAATPVPVPVLAVAGAGRPVPGIRCALRSTCCWWRTPPRSTSAPCSASTTFPSVAMTTRRSLLPAETESQTAAEYSVVLPKRKRLVRTRSLRWNASSGPCRKTRPLQLLLPPPLPLVLLTRPLAGTPLLLPAASVQPARWIQKASCSGRSTQRTRQRRSATRSPSWW